MRFPLSSRRRGSEQFPDRGSEELPLNGARRVIGGRSQKPRENAEILMGETQLQDETERFGRLYIASSAVSRAVARSRSREELLQEVVRVLVDVGKFVMALIAWNDQQTSELIPVARFGDGQAYADRVRMFTDERAEGQGPAGTAFRAGIPYICNDFLSDPHTIPWREVARVYGWRASAAFPILIGGAPQGLLSVYALQHGAFGPDEVELLKQVTLDVAFGIEHLENLERRHQAEAALAASERRLQLALDAAELGTFDSNLTTGKVVWDRRCERIFGFEPGAFEGTREAFQRCVHPEDLPELNRAMEAARDSQSTFSHEFRIIWPNGSEHWLLSRRVFHSSDSGQLDHMYGAVMDITEQKRLDAALRESEERLRQAVRVADIGIFDHDHRTGTTFWSPQLRAMRRYDPDKPVSIPVYMESVHSQDRERIHAAVKRAHDPLGDGLLDLEHRLVFAGGVIRWNRIRSQTFFEGEGGERHPVRTIGAVIDITEQKKAEEEQKKLATLVAMSRDFIGIATLDGRGVYLNQAGMNLVGLKSLEEIHQKTIFDFFDESDQALARESLYKSLLEGRYWSSETRLKHFETGELIDVEMTAFQIRDDNGAPLYIATITKDMRARKREEAEKAKLEERLFQAQKMESIGRLAGGVAHDFNNMLTVINGYSELVLAEMAEGNPQRTLIEQIHKAGETATTLTRQLLAFSRKQVLQPRILDLNRVVKEMRPMLERLVGEDVEVDVELNAKNATVKADPHQIQQVIMNLAVNARDAMASGGRLLIETVEVELDESHTRLHPGAHPGRHVVLAVTDSGIGMDEETRQRIFEPFFTTKPDSQGTGLGLATVLGIVEQSNGHISVKSEPAHGTTFKIYLPAQAEAAADPGKAMRVPPLGGRETVMVVEDRPEVREFVVLALKSYGYGVIEARDAEEAVRLCAQERGAIRLVLTDVVMPKISGRELVNRLEKLRPGIKTMFMSGYLGNVIGQSGALEEGVNFIEKPFSPEELARRVRAVLGPPASARVLVADDEAAVRGFLRAVLEKGGYEVIEVANGKEALQEVRARHVDLVITDLVMPEQEGIATIRALHREAPGVGVIAMSGAFGDQFLRTALLLGASAVLSKPISSELLLAKVAEVLKPQ